MLPPLTPAVGRAVELARRHARALSSATVLPVHLLMALLEEEDGRAFSVAVAAGLAAEQVAAWVRTGPAPEAAEVPLDERTVWLLHQARGMAVELTGESTISSEVVLLAVLRSDAQARTELEGRGLSLDRLESLLQSQRPPLPVLDTPLRL